MNLTEARAAKRQIETPYGRIAYLDVGAGGAIVFLHGFPLNALHWRGVIGRLSSRWRCIAPDLLGLGDSEPLEGATLDFTEQAAMVLAFADALGLRAFHLAGNDSGGAIAQIIAATAGDRIKSLTLTNCDVDENVPPPAFAQAHALAKNGLLSAAIGGMTKNLALARSDFGLGAGFEDGTHITPEVVDAYIAPLMATPARQAMVNRYVAAFASSHLVAVRDALKRLQTPTQILWGTDDVFFSMDDARWLQRTIPGVQRFVEAPGARLFFCEERPGWVAERVAEFLGRPVSAGRASASG